MKVIGTEAPSKNGNGTKKTRFSVVVKHNNKILHRTVGMLFDNERQAETVVARTFSNLGIKLEKGTTLTAEKVDAR